jgi:hypothetical protein
MKTMVWLSPCATVANSAKSRGFGPGQGMAQAIPGHIGPSAHGYTLTIYTS